jgi:hypothetical protein
MNEFLRLMLLYVHLIAFAVTVSAILLEDFWLVTRGFHAEHLARLQATAQFVLPGLLVLILTGIGMCALDFGTDWSALATRPKLLAKFSVVGLLVANGVLLHHLAFPALQRGTAKPRRMAILLCLLGAVSSVSWLYAGFLGIARPLAGRLQWHEFMTIYLLLVSTGFSVALLLTGPELVRFLGTHVRQRRGRSQHSELQVTQPLAGDDHAVRRTASTAG